MIRLFAVFTMAGFSAQGQNLLQSFAPGTDHEFVIEFVTIENPGASADTTGNPNPVGQVDYTYQLGKYEISRDIINKANAAGSLGITLGDLSNFGGNGVNRPATKISWFEAATFVNWLNTSKGFAPAYKFGGPSDIFNPQGFQLWSPSDAGYQANNPFRNNLAKFVIPTRDEWYKGAYGSPDGTWYDYPTGSDTAPTPVVDGLLYNTAVYGQGGDGVSPADVDNAGGLSPWGTMAQGGNVWEWTESVAGPHEFDPYRLREGRGGGWYSDSQELTSSHLGNYGNGSAPADEGIYGGFRVAMVPEPSALSLLAVGLGVVLRRRRRTV